MTTKSNVTMSEMITKNHALVAEFGDSLDRLQDYRNNGVVSYYQLGGKILYKESDIESMLAANYREAFR